MPILALPAADITDPENFVFTESQISDFGDYLLRSGGSVTGDIGMSGNRITGLPTPVNSSEPATMGYVDSIASGLSWKVPVLDKHRTTPPVAPTAGDRHIVADGATGAWSGQDDTIAEWNGSAWEFAAVGDGWVVFVDDTDRYFRFDGDTATWVGLSTALDHNSLTGLADGDPHTQYLNDARAVIWLATQGLDALGVRNAGDLNAGLLLDARVAETNVTQHQAALALSANQITSGQFAESLISASSVTQHALSLSGGTINGQLDVTSNVSLKGTNSTRSLFFYDTGIAVGRLLYAGGNPIGQRYVGLAAQNGADGIRLYTDSDGLASTVERFRVGSGSAIANAVFSNCNLKVLGTTQIQTEGTAGLELLADSANGTLSSRLFLLTGTAGQGIGFYSNAGALKVTTGAIPGTTSGTERFSINTGGQVTVPGVLAVGTRVQISAGVPFFDFIESDTANSNWRLFANAATFYIRSADDSLAELTTPFSIAKGAPTNSFQLLNTGVVSMPQGFVAAAIANQTTDPGVAGQWWNDGGTVKISAG